MSFINKSIVTIKQYDIFINRNYGADKMNAEILNKIEAELHYKIDLANKNALTEIGKQYILNEVIYV
jgi:hypothetical protein